MSPVAIARFARLPGSTVPSWSATPKISAGDSVTAFSPSSSGSPWATAIAAS
jgi:hypothetical protein